MFELFHVIIRGLCPQKTTLKTPDANIAVTFDSLDGSLNLKFCIISNYMDIIYCLKYLV